MLISHIVDFEDFFEKFVIAKVNILVQIFFYTAIIIQVKL